MNENVIARASEIVNEKAKTHELNFCSLALVDADGYPTVSTISISKADGIKWLTFCTGYGSKDEKIKLSDKAGVCINASDYNISLSGRLEVVTDPAVKKEMWYDGLTDHFSGYDDPGYCVLKFTTESYNLLVDWNEAKGRL